jgi:hypothetical protein
MKSKNVLTKNIFQTLSTLIDYNLTSYYNK